MTFNYQIKKDVFCWHTPSKIFVLHISNPSKRLSKYHFSNFITFGFGEIDV